MPIYEYKCNSCGVELEKLQKISDPPLKECPECGKSSMKKLISATSFRLKGSGWYETDFKNSGKKAAANEKSEQKDSGSADGSKKSGSAGKSENKPESKSSV